MMWCNGAVVVAATASPSFLPVIYMAQRYYSTVLAWGRNVEGQCAAGSDAVVLQPTVVVSSMSSSLEDSIQSVHAGKQNSCFLSKQGFVWTWGCGRAGKLGHGSADSLALPAQVEALVGRANVKHVALGEQHSLFLDDDGNVWGCGKDNEGQCGLGTQQHITREQHNQAWQMRQPAQQLPLMAPLQAQSSFARSLSLTPPSGTSSPMSTTVPVPPLHHAASPSLLNLGTVATNSTAWTLLNGTAIDMAQHLALRGLEPGQLHTPLRLGHGMINHLFAPMGDSQRPAWLDGSSIGLGLNGQQVVSLAASKYFSAVATAEGEVLTFGACYNGGLGAVTSYSPYPTPLERQLERVIHDAGGAVKVSVGARCCMALLQDGRAVLWGKLSHATSEFATAAGLSSSRSNPQPQNFTIVQGLPRLTDIAAGQQHALLTDGDRVWSIGRWVDATGAKIGSSTSSRPAEVLHLKGERVSKLVAGPSSSAVVTDSGRVWLWGKLLDRHHAEGLACKVSQDFTAEEAAWQWPGLGSNAPTRVPGLEGVTDLALGGWHALALQG